MTSMVLVFFIFNLIGAIIAAPIVTSEQQYRLVPKNTFHLKADSENEQYTIGEKGIVLDITLETDTTLTDSLGRKVFIDENTGEFQLNEELATKGFNIEEGLLNLNGNIRFFGCPSGEKFYLSSMPCHGGSSLSLRAS